jgi:hypothetical protein
MGGQTSLIEQRILRVRSLTDGELIKMQGIVHCYSMDERGQRWVRKRDIETGPESTLAECVSWLLAQEIDAPVPRGALFGEGTNELSWLSGLVHPVLHWDPEHWDSVVNQEALGKIIALDAVTLNEDRHVGNLLLEAQADGALYLWGIDFGNALIGQSRDLPKRIEEAPNVVPGKPAYTAQMVAAVADVAMNAAAQLSALPSHVVASFAWEAVCAMPARDAPPVDDFTKLLSRRCEDAKLLTEKFLHAIEEGK